jgi:hypothetical protein
LILQITAGRIKSWDDIHDFYEVQAEAYPKDKLIHAMAALKKVHGINLKKAPDEVLKTLLSQSISIREWMVKGIFDSRAKDYTNPFRQMVYNSVDEMNVVTGKLNDNSFINKEVSELKAYRATINKTLRKLKIT